MLTIVAENVPGNDLIDDCNVLRSVFKSTSREFSSLAPDANAAEIPQDGGIQVLPILWRANLNIGTEILEDEKVEKKETPRQILLSDITLEGVPAIRGICNDVIVSQFSFRLTFCFT